jgi:hypothetical protein
MVRPATGSSLGEEEILYIISNIFAKPQVFYYLVSDAKIFDIIYLLSPLLECDPTVCLPYRGSQSYWWRKLEYPEKTTDLPQVTYKLYYIMLYRLLNVL